MPDFFGVWLPIWVCTWSAALYRHLSNHKYALTPLVVLIGVELGALVVWLFYWMVLYPRYLTPFRHLPTPAKRRLLYGNRNEMFPDQAWLDLRQVYQTLPNEGLVRYYEPLNKEVLLATKPEVVKEMFGLKSNDFGHPKNVQFMINQLTGSEFNFLSPHGHKSFRKHLRPAFTAGHIRKIMPTIWEKSDQMVSLLQDEVQQNDNPTVDLRDYIRTTMWDIFGLVVLGHDFQTLEKPNTGAKARFSGILRSLNGPAIKWGYFIINYIDIRPLLVIFSPLLMKSPAGKALAQIRNTIRRAIDDKESRSHKKPLEEDHLGIDITAVSMTSGIFPTSELVDNGMLFLTAGPNSTGTAVEWAIYELGRHPEMQTRLREEITQACSQGGGLLRSVDVQNLSYLSAVVNETIRCYPFVPLSPRVAERDTTLLGERIPQGTVVLTVVEAFNRDESLWGEDADAFRPERWLGEGREGSGGAVSNYAMLSFGAGPGACIGQGYARVMVAVMVASLVSRFDIELVNAETAGKLRAAPFKRSEEGMLVRLKVLE